MTDYNTKTVAELRESMVKWNNENKVNIIKGVWKMNRASLIDAYIKTMVKKDIKKIKDDVKDMKNEFSEMKNEIKELKEEIKELKKAIIQRRSVSLTILMLSMRKKEKQRR
jgi:peptidoglycan hydrolase CwlO-like protein